MGTSVLKSVADVDGLSPDACSYFAFAQPNSEPAGELLSPGYVSNGGQILTDCAAALVIRADDQRCDCQRE